MSAESPQLQTVLLTALAMYDSPRDKREALDDVLRSICAVIDILRTERNNSVPINSLPSELLVQIFRSAAASRPSVSLLSVCRRWRAVAEDSPTLWSNIVYKWETLRKHEFLDQLKRSKEAPLRVAIGMLASKGIIDRLIANAHRLTYLDIGGAREYLVDLMQKMSAHDFPVLSDLRLQVTRKKEETGDDDDDDDEDAAVTVELPSEVLDGRIPALHRLELLAIAPQWTSLRSLRYLVINPKDTSPAHPLQFHVLLSVLQACPELIELEIHLILDVGAQELYFPVVLPHLESLKLRDHVHYFHAFFRFVSFPATTRLALYPLGVRDGSDIRELLVPLRKHLRSPAAPIACALSITVPERKDDENISHLLVDVDREELDRYREASLFRINSHPPRAPAVRQILVKILHTIPIANITHLDVSCASLSHKSWKVVLRLLPAVRSVALSSDDGGEQFCDTLAEMLVSVRDATVQRSPSSLPLPLPHLCRLTVRVYNRLPDELSAVETFLGAFKRVLREYHDVGRRIECAKFMGQMFWITLEGGTPSRVPLVDNWDDVRGLVNELVIDNAWY
ncbi:hypothetical protein C8F01DRAFT_1150456 [Mycena amicta]|nr:hypothetical protein C8F01DRAFT_1150456 [Mycena amicta]